MKLRDDELGGCGICHVDSTIETAKSREKATRKTVSGFSLYLGWNYEKNRHQNHVLLRSMLFGCFVMQNHVFCFAGMFVCVCVFFFEMRICECITCMNLKYQIKIDGIFSQKRS